MVKISDNGDFYITIITCDVTKEKGQLLLMILIL